MILPNRDLSMKIPFGKYKGKSILMLDSNSKYVEFLLSECRLYLHKFPKFEKYLLEWFTVGEYEWNDELENKFLEKYEPEKFKEIEMMKNYVYILHNRYDESAGNIMGVFNSLEDMEKEFPLVFDKSQPGYIRTAWYISKWELGKLKR